MKGDCRSADRNKLLDRIGEISESCSQMVLQFHGQIQVEKIQLLHLYLNFSVSSTTLCALFGDLAFIIVKSSLLYFGISKEIK